MAVKVTVQNDGKVTEQAGDYVAGVVAERTEGKRELRVLLIGEANIVDASQDLGDLVILTIQSMAESRFEYTNFLIVLHERLKKEIERQLFEYTDGLLSDMRKSVGGDKE